MHTPEYVWHIPSVLLTERLTRVTDTAKTTTISHSVRLLVTHQHNNTPTDNCYHSNNLVLPQEPSERYLLDALKTVFPSTMTNSFGDDVAYK
jgi:hypothetical protein